MSKYVPSWEKMPAERTFCKGHYAEPCRQRRSMSKRTLSFTWARGPQDDTKPINWYLIQPRRQTPTKKSRPKLDFSWAHFATRSDDDAAQTSPVFTQESIPDEQNVAIIPADDAAEPSPAATQESTPIVQNVSDTIEMLNATCQPVCWTPPRPPSQAVAGTFVAEVYALFAGEVHSVSQRCPRRHPVDRSPGGIRQWGRGPVAHGVVAT